LTRHILQEDLNKQKRIVQTNDILRSFVAILV
jgi:hypothetical protein